MSLEGHVENGVVVFDEPVSLPNGTLVRVEVVPTNDAPLSFQEHEKVRVTMEPAPCLAERTAGMLKWAGDPDLLRRIAEDDEFGILESP